MNYQILVNKENSLDRGFIPSNLVNTNSKYKKNIYLNKEVLNHFLNMKYDMQLLGYDIDIMSGYRDYNHQEKIYNKSLYQKGYTYTIRSIAKPGTSEHQTGLAIDICLYKNNKVYIEHEIMNTKELEFIKENAHKYGFILRYPEDKENITGYNYEPWHYRYVGASLANYLYKNNLTLEEYYNRERKEETNNKIIFIKEAKI